MIQETTNRGTQSTAHHLKGELGEVLQAVEGLFRKFNAQGYGTRVSEIVMDDDGQYSAKLVRFNSCD